MSERVFKVVFDTSLGNPLSAVVRNEAAVEYLVGQATKPELGMGPLCAFKTVGDARKFAQSNVISPAIYLCDAEPSGETEVWWEAAKYTRKGRPTTASLVNRRHIITLPDGTILCDSITPVRRITWVDSLCDWVRDWLNRHCDY